MGSVKANGREPKTCLGRVFNYKLGCFDDVYLFNYVDIRPHLSLKTQPRFSPGGDLIKTFGVNLLTLF